MKLKSIYNYRYKLFFAYLLFCGLFVCFFTSPQVALAANTTYYVSPSGNNSNTGTSQSQAWQTITKVNSTTFGPGDQILFEGGQTFTGNIYFDTPSAGNSSNPITVSSYGVGNATINAGNSFGIFAYDNGGFLVSNLTVTGSGVSTNTQDGIIFYNDLAGNVKKDHVYIDNVTVSGFGKQGVVVGGANGTSGYHDVRITRVTAYTNGRNGIIVYGSSLYSNTNVYIGHCVAYDNKGIVGFSGNTGSGIILGSVDGGTIEYSRAYSNGENNTYSQGPVGIWAYDSHDVTLQFNESYNNKTNGADGGGFDLDVNVTDSIMQYNYSHDNDGAGYLLTNFEANDFSNNTVRYNISENDARKNSLGAITLYGKLSNTEIYNNTIYLTPASSGTAKAFYMYNLEATDPSAIHIRNNIFQTTGSAPVVSVTADALDSASGILFQGNDYYPTQGAFTLSWGNATYNSLDTWRSATNQEIQNAVFTGFSIDPGLSNPGNGGTIGNADQLATLSAYKLMQNSALINNGLNLLSLFSINPGTRDFYDTVIPINTFYDIGANEYSPGTSPVVSSILSSVMTPICTDAKPIAAPDLFQITAASNAATLYFTPLSAPVTKYFISFGYVSGDQRFGIEVPAWSLEGVLSFTLNYLTPNTPYYVRVRGGNGCQPGDWSNELKIKTISGKRVGGIQYYEVNE